MPARINANQLPNQMRKKLGLGNRTRKTPNKSSSSSDISDLYGWENMECWKCGKKITNNDRMYEHDKETGHGRYQICLIKQ